MFIGGDQTSVWRADMIPGKNSTPGRPVRVGTLPAAVAGAFDPAAERILQLLPNQTGPGAITIVQNWLKK